ncbi:transglycosylase domain-containing protein [Pseudoalteromonas sp. G4]|uniref:transglycosylase domain-containing protein n=1 Tax=Pseudoalteromonas sp. G4 TaxID=2992761 RepID=UPI00237E4D3B|nr:transglycosylase domain-containing protein [Pseudoalteromonas sp. G4]MDE3274357.1 transglycosylase domain-containing protein [Pseudoalteromonas sp. G4]
MAEREILKLGYFLATIPYLFISKIAHKFNLWGLRDDVNKCLEVVARYNHVILPKKLLLTLELGEDHRSQIHLGIDQIAICRSLFSTIKGQIQGASTIEQQFVRVVVNRYQRTLNRKILEQLLAVYMSSILSKGIISKTYLCIAYYGVSEQGVMRLKEFDNKAFVGFTYSDAIRVIARLKYPQPLIRNKLWQLKFEQRTIHLSNKLSMLNIHSKPSEFGLASKVDNHSSSQYFVYYP